MCGIFYILHKPIFTDEEYIIQAIYDNAFFILSIISCLGVVVSIVSTLKKDSEARTNEKLDIEKNFVKINVKLDSFCDQIKTMLHNQEKANDEIKKLSNKLIQDDERIETLFNYYRQLEKQISRFENRGEKNAKSN